MTVSGTTAFSMTVAQIVTQARTVLGVQDVEEPVQAHELQQGILTLNLMLHAWQADGVQTWVLTEGSFALVQDDYDYVIGAGGSFTTVPLEITDVRINRSSRDMPMIRLSREEYYALPDKTVAGYPTQFYYDRQREGGTFFVWPAPDSGLGTIKFTYRRYVMDAGDGTTALDLPVEWLQAIVYNLARHLIPVYSGLRPDTVAFIMREADRTYRSVSNFDTGEGQGSIMFAPGGDD